MSHSNQTNAISTKQLPLLGVNIDHVATLRQARGVDYPDPIQAARICEQAGADGITLHLREDRRHIQDKDVYAMINQLSTRMNLELAATPVMIDIACDVTPEWVCLVPEKREELTTEGGLNVVNQPYIKQSVNKLQQAGIKVSLFIDPDNAQIDASVAANADAIELHTGAYAEANSDTQRLNQELCRIQQAVAYANLHYPSLIVNAGHGLTLDNVHAIASIKGIYELNIGHALIADAIFKGLAQAVQDFKQAIQST